jgi:antitoxin component of MazEF toxin-antitoxin module
VAVPDGSSRIQLRNNGGLSPLLPLKRLWQVSTDGNGLSREKWRVFRKNFIDNCINIVYTYRWRLKLWKRLLKNGSFVDIKDKKGEIIIKPKEKNKLSEILRKINKKNIHAEVETNGPVGNELKKK